MGNVFGRGKKPITEELDNLSAQMKTFKGDIEKTFESKRMILWYLSLSTFFLSTSIIGYIWFHFEKKEHQIGLSLLTFLAGLVLIWLGRRLTNSYYDWRLNSKRKALDELIAKKKDILETVKETETFKVAKEILEKYDTEAPARSQSQPSTPATEKRAPLPNKPTGPQKGPMPIGATPMGQGPRGGPMNGPRGPGPVPMGPTPARSMQNIPMATPQTGMNRPRGPVRPFQKESSSAMDKMVDYFFGDGPGQRLALICAQCHGHNGMSMPQEYEYMAYVCFICGHFNPAKKLRPVVPRPPTNMPMPMGTSAATPGNSPQAPKKPQSLEKDKDSDSADDTIEKVDDKEPIEDEFDIVSSSQATTDDETAKSD